jgi:hypothetical protein
MIGSVSLTNKQGVFLGSVNLDNLNIAPDQVAYSTDGINLSGASLGAGLENPTGSLLKTVGNPAIQLTSNSQYVNDGNKSIATGISLCDQGDVVYVSAGSYGESQISITDKVNIGILAPPVGTVANTITEVLNGFSITGTSDLIRIANFQIKGAASQFSGVGRTKLSNCIFTGTSLQTNAVTFGTNSTKFITVIDCEFDQYCTVTVASTFTSAIYFINCNFGGATITLNNASPLQVIFNNCSGFSAFPTTAKATFVGLNVLTTGVSQVNTYDLKTTQINGAAPLSVSSQANTLIPFCTATSQSLSCDADFNFTSSTNTLAVPNLQVTNINGSTYPPSSGGGVTVSNQTLYRIPYCTNTSNTLDCEAGFEYNSLTDTLSALNIDTTRINAKLVAGITEQFEGGICVAAGNENLMYNYAGFSYDQEATTLAVPNLTVTNINGAPYSGGTSLTGFRKNIYYQKSNTTAQTAETISLLTSSTLSFDITKQYIVNVSYSFSLDTGSGAAHTVQFAIRDTDSVTYDEVQFSNLANLHLVNLTFRFTPLLASTPLAFLVSCTPHDVINTSTDVIIWTIDEIQ